MHFCNETESGIKNLLFDYLQLDLDRKDKLLLISHSEHLERFLLCENFISQARRYGIVCNLLDSANDFETIKEEFDKYDTIVYAEGTNSTHSQELITYLSLKTSYTQTFFRVFDFTIELLSKCFRISRSTLQQLNESIICKGSQTSAITVRSSLGTDIKIDLVQKYGWINSCGLSPNGKPGVLPPSEVATYSNFVNGIIYADGAINTNFGFPLDPRLAKNPIKIELVNSKVVSFECDSVIIKYLLQKFFQIENADRVGEIGFGTNIGLQQFVPFVSHINERFPSLHLGFGAHNQNPKRVNWACPLHLDIILDQCEIFFDDDLILQNHTYTQNEVPAEFNFDQVPIGYIDTL
jgi:aminopeptidase